MVWYDGVVRHGVVHYCLVEQHLVWHGVLWYNNERYSMYCKQTLNLFFCSSTFTNTTLIISNITSSSLISVNHVTISVDPSCNLVAFSNANSSFFPSSAVLDVISSQDLLTSLCILRNVLATDESLVFRSSLLVFMICSYLGVRDSTSIANS